jgi:hypothetical protein
VTSVQALLIAAMVILLPVLLFLVLFVFGARLENGLLDDVHVRPAEDAPHPLH